jgi:hypothetical protein
VQRNCPARPWPFARKKRILDRAIGRGLGDASLGCGGRILALGQAVYFVIEKQNVDINIPPQQVDKVIAPNGHGIAISRDEPDTEFRIGQFYSCGDAAPSVQIFKPRD